MLEKKNFYINGEWTPPSKKNDFEVINPSNEDPFAIISLGFKEDTDAAVNAAKKAFDNWKETSIEERISCFSSLSIISKTLFAPAAP